MLRALILVAVCSMGVWPGRAAAQDPAVVITIEAGGVRLNEARLIRSLERATHRRLIRVTDEAARQAAGRLSLAHSRPDRWVIRYESGGQVGWVADRIRGSRGLRTRLVALAENVVAHVEAAHAAPVASATSRRSGARWDVDVIRLLREELLDPFEGLPPAPGSRDSDPIAILWTEVLDPFAGEARVRPLSLRL